MNETLAQLIEDNGYWAVLSAVRELATMEARTLEGQPGAWATKRIAQKLDSVIMTAALSDDSRKEV